MEQNNNSTEEQVQTVNYVGEEAYKALYRRLSTQIAGTKGDTEAIIANLGSMSVGDMTIRELLGAIKTDALTLQQLTEAKDAITALIGAASDSSSASTVFGKIAEAIRIISETKGDTEAIISKLGEISAEDLANKIHEVKDTLGSPTVTEKSITDMLRKLIADGYNVAFVRNNDGAKTGTLTYTMVLSRAKINEQTETLTL